MSNRIPPDRVDEIIDAAKGRIALAKPMDFGRADSTVSKTRDRLNDYEVFHEKFLPRVSHNGMNYRLFNRAAMTWEQYCDKERELVGLVFGAMVGVDMPQAVSPNPVVMPAKPVSKNNFGYSPGVQKFAASLRMPG